MTPVLEMKRNGNAKQKCELELSSAHNISKASARGAETQSRTQEAPPKRLGRPAVGELWPDLKPRDVRWPDSNHFSAQFCSMSDQKGTMKSFSLRVNSKTYVFGIALLFLITVFAIRKDDRGLIKEVVDVLGGGSRSHAVTESPPR
jgi:hypothetical protein